MTSSLVGSEMCIRDSSLQDKLCSKVIGDCEQLLNAGYISLGARLGAVSYTHLTLPTICSV
eukprot:1725291-Prorocentrum_lima.AAC.1